jgi:hypothetical protein
MHVDLFDLSDGANGTLSFIQSNTDGSDGPNFTNCVGTRGPITFGGSTNTCTFSTNTSTYNHKWNGADIPIPTNYTCTPSVATSCWIKIKYVYASTPTDTTSWKAALQGDPVRLIQ